MIVKRQDCGNQIPFGVFLFLVYFCAANDLLDLLGFVFGIFQTFPKVLRGSENLP